MQRNKILLLAFVFGTYAFAQANVPKSVPAKGDNGQVGGVFGLSFGGSGGAKPPSQQGAPKGGMGALGAPPGMQTGSESPPGGRGSDDKLSGTGPYPAQMWPIDPNFKGHTVYAPKTPPTGVKLPALIWGNGGCSNGGTGFQNFLREIASHGFIVAANGEGGPPGMGQTKMISMTESLDWIMKGAGGGKYGEVDSSKIAAAGQSCGGLEALSASYHDDRVKTTLVMNSGVFNAGQKALLKELKAPIAYFIGGPKDIAYQNAETDWAMLPEGLPAIKANLDTGHLGTYGAPSGGKFGKAAVAYLKWALKGDKEAKNLFTDRASMLYKDNWNITLKNWT